MIRDYEEGSGLKGLLQSQPVFIWVVLQGEDRILLLLNHEDRVSQHGIGNGIMKPLFHRVMNEGIDEDGDGQ